MRPDRRLGRDDQRRVARGLADAMVIVARALMCVLSWTYVLLASLERMSGVGVWLARPFADPVPASRPSIWASSETGNYKLAVALQQPLCQNVVYLLLPVHLLLPHVRVGTACRSCSCPRSAHPATRAARCWTSSRTASAPTAGPASGAGPSLRLSRLLPRKKREEEEARKWKVAAAVCPRGAGATSIHGAITVSRRPTCRGCATTA